MNCYLLEVFTGIGVLTHYKIGVRKSRFCQELHIHASAWWTDVCQFQFTTLGWLKLVLDDILFSDHLILILANLMYY